MIGTLRFSIFLIALSRWILGVVSNSVFEVSNDFTTESCVNFQCPNIYSAMKELQTGDQILISPGTYSGINNTGFNPLRFGLSGSYSFHRASIMGNGDPAAVVIIGGLFNTRFMDLYDDGFVLISNITFKDFALPKVTTYVSNELQVLGVNVVGGTFSVTNASIEFKNLNFYNNSALFGAAISAVTSDISVANCEFAYNLAGYHGGAISVGQSSITVTGSRFYNNSASSVRQQLAASGGAIFSVGVTTNHTTIINSIFVNNTADHNGGAVSLEPGTTLPQLSTGSVLFKHCKFYKNEASGVGSCLSTTSCIPAGGAIYVTSANVSVVGCHFEENRAHTLSTIDVSTFALFACYRLSLHSIYDFVHHFASSISVG